MVTIIIFLEFIDQLINYTIYCASLIIFISHCILCMGICLSFKFSDKEFYKYQENMHVIIWWTSINYSQILVGI